MSQYSSVEVTRESPHERKDTTLSDRKVEVGIGDVEMVGEGEGMTKGGPSIWDELFVTGGPISG